MKFIFICASLVVILFSNSIAQGNKAADVTRNGIQIGQKVPDFVLKNVYNYKSKTARLSDFKGKLVILDFWATWCAPCVAMIPKMDSLQKTMGNKIQFLSVTYQSEKEVIPFLNNLEKKKSKNYTIPVVTDEKGLLKMFPHIYLPHYVWIDGNGIVKAITNFEEVTSDKINSMLKSNDVVLTQKKDLSVPYDRTKPLLSVNNGGNWGNLLFQSVLTSYTPGLEGGVSTFAPDSVNGGRIVLRNVSLDWIYNCAFGKGREWLGANRIIFEVKDPSRFVSYKRGDEYLDWLQRGNGFCYELIVPKNLADSIYFIMQDDLKRIFKQYEVKMERRQTKSIVLTCIDKSKLPISKAGFSADILVTKMNMGLFQNHSIPIVNGTDISGLLAIQLDGIDSIEEINQVIEPYGLKFIEKLAPVEMLVYRDAKSN